MSGNIEYISRATVTIDGETIDDIQSITINTLEKRRIVNLMNKTGFSKVTVRTSGSIVYVVPAVGGKTKGDFLDAEDFQVVAEYEGGKKETIRRAFVLSVGDSSTNGDGETTFTVEFGAAEEPIEEPIEE